MLSKYISHIAALNKTRWWKNDSELNLLFPQARSGREADVDALPTNLEIGE
jgi:hypothetical protein